MVETRTNSQEEKISYPKTPDEIDKACGDQIAQWYCHLPSPITAKEIYLNNIICSKFRELNKKR